MKRMMLVFFTLGLLTLMHCIPEFEEVVAETYADGTPKVIKYFDGKGKAKTMVKKIVFYPNGQVRMEGEFKEGAKHGRWVAYYNNGNKWSEGYYNKGINDGKTATWHENGQKYYEGAFKNGERAGIWKFWNEKGAFEKEINYGALK